MVETGNGSRINLTFGQIVVFISLIGMAVSGSVYIADLRGDLQATKEILNSFILQQNELWKEEHNYDAEVRSTTRMLGDRIDRIKSDMVRPQ